MYKLEKNLEKKLISNYNPLGFTQDYIM
jgi:hypothetical protein